MPVTPAHAAAVVPLRLWKRYFWLSPLVVGSMAPDFIYFVFPPPSYRHFGHTPLGLVLFCVPAGLAVLFAYHRFFKRPLVLLLPRSVRAKLWTHCGPFPLWPLRRLLWIAALILLGAITHVVWDGFTHENGLAVFDYLQMYAAMIAVAGQETYLFAVLQEASSLLGLGLLAWWSWQWYRTAPLGREPADPAFLKRARPAIAATMIIFAAGAGIVCGLGYAHDLQSPFNAVAAFIAGVDAFGLALLIFAVVVNVSAWSAARAAKSPGSYRLLRDLSGGPRERL